MNLNWIYSDTATTALAGAAGGIVRWLTLRHDWREGLMAIVVGAICALYLGPVIEPLLEPIIGKIAPQGDASGFSSFMTGLAGISLTGLLLDVINIRRKLIGDSDAKSTEKED
ncbi:hypothetical protein [Profundibacter sp.]